MTLIATFFVMSCLKVKKFHGLYCSLLIFFILYYVFIIHYVSWPVLDNEKYIFGSYKKYAFLDKEVMVSYCPSQFSTETGLLYCSHEIYTKINACQFLLAISLHFSAAFDIIDRQLLLMILEEKVGLTGTV